MGGVVEGLAGREYRSKIKNPASPQVGEARLITEEPVNRRGLIPLISLSLSLSLYRRQRRTGTGPVTVIQGKEGISVYLSHDTPARGGQL